MPEKYLTARMDAAGSAALAAVRPLGAYATAERVLRTLAPEHVTQIVLDSNLRGRGGAGFPTGRKWTFMPKDHPGPRYLAVNADEGEPGTCKDRILMNRDPHLLLEGIVLACYAIRAAEAYIYLRGEYLESCRALNSAIAEAEGAGFLGSGVMGTNITVRVHVHRGAGAYICGEETSLMESLEGWRGHPRPKPPFPAVAGLWKKPTAVNNVETICNLPAILERGAEWFRSIGTPESSGNLLYQVSGHVNAPGVFELPLGTCAAELIDTHAGGVWKGRRLKAFIPGGISTGYLPASMAHIPMDHGSLMKAGSMLGTGGVIVMDETTDIVETLEVLTSFYRHETCGQCAPCREGCAWSHRIVKRILQGKGTPADLDQLEEIAQLSERGKTICVFPDAITAPVRSAIKYFRDDFLAHMPAGRPAGAVPGASS